MTQKNHTRGLALRALSLGIAAALAAPVAMAQSLPTGAVPGGSNSGIDATVVTSGNTMTVTPGAGATRSIINWNSFDVAQGFTFQFDATNASDILLNRVTGGVTSNINGLVQSNGNVWVLNPNGISVGATGQFNVAGLLLSGLDMADADFLDGDNTFNFLGISGAGVGVAPGAQLNANGGAIALISNFVNSGGVLNAGTGEVALVGARDVTIGFDANLNTFTTLTINTGSNQANAVRLGGNTQVTAGRTVLAAAGVADGQGNVLLVDDNAADNISFAGGDVVLYAGRNTGNGITAANVISGGAVQAIGSAGANEARVLATGRISTPGNLRIAAAGGTGQGSTDLDLSAGGALDIENTVRGQDVALNATGSVSLGAGDSRDDFVIRSNGIVASGVLRSGVTVDGLAALDVAGAGDVLNGPTLSGNDMSLYGENGTVDLAVAPVVGDSYRVRGTDFFGSALAPTWRAGSFENTFVITDTAGGFNAGNLSSLGRLWIEVRNGGDLNVTGPLSSTRGDVQLITTGGGNINLGGNVTSGTRSGSVNEHVVLNSSGAINQTAGIIDTTLSTSGSLHVRAVNGVSLLGANLFANAAFQNSGAGGIAVRNARAGGFNLTNIVLADGFNPNIAGAATGGGDVRFAIDNGSMLVNAVPVATGAGNIIIDGATTLAAGTTTLTATGGNATFNGAIDGQAAGQGDLVVNAGTTTFNGNVGASNAVSSVVVNGATTLNANTVSAANVVDLDDLTVAASLAGDATLTAQNGALTVGAVTANHGGALVGNSATVNVASFAGPSASLALNSTAGSLAVGAVNAGGTVGLSATGGDLAATTVDAAGNVTADATGAVRASALRSTGGTVSVTAGTDIGGATAGSRMDITGAGQVNVNATGAALLGTVASTGAGVAAVTNGLDVTTANAAGILSLNGGTGGIALGSGSGNSTSLNTSGAINVAGPLTTNLLVGSAGGSATLAGANAIAELGNFTAAGLTLNNARGLVVSGTVNAGTGDASIAVTGGNLEIASTGQVRGAGVDLSTDANFLNRSGSDAVVAGNRWVIYSQAPAGNVFDNLDSGNTAFWNATRATLAPGNVNGNRYVFAFQPRLTLTTDSVTKVYGTDLTGNPGVGFTITGYQPGVAGAFLGDTQATVFNGTPRVTSDGFAPRASVNGGPYGITVDPTSLATNGGYAVDVSNAGSVTVTPLAITGTPNVDNKTYDGSTAGTGRIVLNGVLSGDNVGANATFTFVDPNSGVRKQVNITGLALTGADAGNYTVTLSGAALADILARAITVTADPKTKQVGNPDPALTYTITNGSLVAGDSLTGALTRAPGETAGSYAIGQGTLNASSNYRLTFVGSTLTITEAPTLPEPPPAPVLVPGSAYAREMTDLLDRMDELTPSALSQAEPLEVLDQRPDCDGPAGRQQPGCPAARPE